MKAIAILLAVTLLLSGCSLIQPVTELMKPPKLSAQQIEVDAALKSALGTGAFTLKYPRSGEYRSAYVFFDIDADGVEEALVFYQPDVEGSGVRINILDFTPERGWYSVYDVPGKGSGDVDFITFSNIQSPDYQNIVIGWQPQQNAKEKILTIYRYQSQKLHSVFEERYNQSVLYDFDKDKLADMVLISLRTSSVLYVSSTAETVSVQDEISISRDVQEIVQLLPSPLPDGRQALFLDVLLEGANYATEILTLENGKLRSLINIEAVYTGDGEEVLPIAYQNFALTQRPERILSSDINGDGYVEVPSSTPMLGYGELQEEELRYLTSYSQLQGDSFTPIISAAVNLSAGYLVEFPLRWQGTVTVVAENDMSWQFIKYNESLNDRSVELLRVNRILKNDYQDRFSSDYVLLEQKGLYSFYGYRPPTAEAELSLTEEEMKSLFSLI